MTQNNDIPLIEEWPVTQDGVSYLCVTRSAGANREHGFLLNGQADVHVGYIWDGGCGFCIEYEAFTDVTADGWEVD